MASIAFCTQHWELLVQSGSFRPFQTVFGSPTCFTLLHYHQLHLLSDLVTQIMLLSSRIDLGHGCAFLALLFLGVCFFLESPKENHIIRYYKQFFIHCTNIDRNVSVPLLGKWFRKMVKPGSWITKIYRILTLAFPAIQMYVLLCILIKVQCLDVIWTFPNNSLHSQQMVTCMQPFGSTLCFFFHDFRPVVQTVLLRKGRKNNLNQTQKRGLPELNPSHDNQYNCCFILVLNRITRGRDYDL